MGHDRHGKLQEIVIDSEYGNVRYMRIVYERGYVTYEVDLIKDRCSNYQHFYEETGDDKDSDNRHGIRVI